MDKENLKEEFKEKVEKVKDFTEEGAEKAKEVAEKAKDAVSDGIEKTQEFVEKNPKKASAFALGIGAAIGLAVSKLFGREKK